MIPTSVVTSGDGTRDLHQRLQRWRHRERSRHPGLFASSLSPATSPPPVTMRRLRNGRGQLLIGNVLILLCDGCGALLGSPNADQAASSASTVAPTAVADESSSCWVSCDHCSFTTPMGSLRRLLDMTNDRGPCFEPGIVQALLVEAIGAPSSCRLRDKMLREWVLDTNCRMDGLDELCGALGIRDEQLEPALGMDGIDETVAMIEAERFLERAVPKDFMPSIPFSASQIRAGASNENSESIAIAAREAAERAKNLVTEAVRVWQNATGDTDAAILKLRALGKEFVVERTRARSYNLAKLQAPGKIQITQEQQQPSNAYAGDVTGAVANM